MEEAEDAPTALKILQYFPADVLITDWNMQPLNGIEFTQLVRTAKDSKSPEIPIIMLTGFAEVRRVIEARDAGVNEFLAKLLLSQDETVNVESAYDGFEAGTKIQAQRPDILLLDLMMPGLDGLEVN